MDVAGYAALVVRRSQMELMQLNGLIDVSKRWLGSTGAVWRETDYLVTGRPARGPAFPSRVGKVGPLVIVRSSEPLGERKP